MRKTSGISLSPVTSPARFDPGPPGVFAAKEFTKPASEIDVERLQDHGRRLVKDLQAEDDHHEVESGSTKSITSNSSNVSSDEKDREKIEILTRSTTDQINALQAKKRTTPKTNGMDMIDQKGLELISLETKEFDKSKFSLF